MKYYNIEALHESGKWYVYCGIKYETYEDAENWVNINRPTILECVIELRITLISIKVIKNFPINND